MYHGEESGNDWHTYCGLAGDSHLLLTVVNGNGNKRRTLINRDLPFYEMRLRHKIRRLRKNLKNSINNQE